MNSRPKCFIVENHKRHDLTGAEVYGDVVLLYDKQPADVFMLSKHAHGIKRMLEDASDKDYLVISGNMILVMLAFGVLLQKLGSVNVLLFDVRNVQYVPRVIAKHQI